MSLKKCMLMDSWAIFHSYAPLSPVLYQKCCTLYVRPQWWATNPLWVGDLGTEEKNWFMKNFIYIYLLIARRPRRVFYGFFLQKKEKIRH
jgi:hypothetical protein